MFTINIVCISILLLWQSQLIHTQLTSTYIELVNVSLFDFNSNSISLNFNDSTVNSFFDGSAIILSNSSNLNTSCTFRNLTFESIVSSENQTSVTIILDTYSSNLLRLSIGNNQTHLCLVNDETTFIYIGMHFFSNKTLVNPSPINPLLYIPDITQPNLVSWNINLLNGYMDILFDEPVMLDLNFFSQLALYFSPEGSSQIFFPIDSLNVSVDSSFRLQFFVNLNYTELTNISENYCFDPSFCYLIMTFAGGLIYTDVFGNTLVNFFSILVSNFVPFNVSYFSSLMSSFQTVGVNQLLFSWIAPLFGNSDVINYKIYLFPNKTQYFRGDCDYHPLYTILIEETAIYNSSDTVLSNIPDCVNASNYHCTVTTNTSAQLNSFPGFDHIVFLVTTYTNRPENIEQFNFTSAKEYTQLLQFYFFVQFPSKRSIRGLNPSDNRHDIFWTLHTLFCINHRLSLFHGIGYLGGTYIDIDDNTACYTGNATLFAPLNNVFFVNAEILIYTTSLTQNLLPPGTCQFVTFDIIPLTFSSEGPESFNVADRPLISSYSFNPENVFIFPREVRGIFLNVRKILNLNFINTPNIFVEFSNIYVIPTYALEYVPPNGFDCNSLSNFTDADYFRIKPTIYYPYAFNDLSSQNKFNLTCPPPNGEFYTCFSVINDGFLNPSITIDLFQDYSTTIIIEDAFLVYTNATASLEYTRSLPYNFTHYFDNSFPSSFYNTFFGYYLPSIYRCLQNSVILTRAQSLANITTNTNPCSITEEMYIHGLTQNSDYRVTIHQFSVDTCTSGIEATTPILSTYSAYTGPIAILRTMYIDHNTFSFQYQFNASLTNIQSIVIFSVPTIIPNFVTATDGNSDYLCPSFVDLNSTIMTNGLTTLATNISNSSTSLFNQFVTCEPSNQYFCLKLDNPTSTGSVTIPVHSFLFHEIRLNIISTEGSVIESSTFLQAPLPSFADTPNTSPISGGNTTATTVTLSWNPDYFCPNQSFVVLELRLLEQRRGLQPIIPMRKIELCSSGAYKFDDLIPNTFYTVDAYFLYNNTVIETNGFVGTCPYIITSTMISTSRLVPDILLLTFSTVKIFWETPNFVTSYIGGVYPLSFEYISQPVCNATSYQAIMTLMLNQEFISAAQCVSEGCITSNTVSNEVILAIPPGFDYLAFLITNPASGIAFSIFTTNELLDLTVNIISGQKSVFFIWDKSLCTNDTGVYIPTLGNASYMYSCTIGSVEIPFQNLNLSEVSLNFIFPLNASYISDQNLTVNSNNSCGIILRHTVSSFNLVPIPFGVAPRIEFIIPLSDQNVTNAVYLLPIPQISSYTQLLLHYTVYAFPNSPMFIFSNLNCPSTIDSVNLQLFQQETYSSSPDLFPLSIFNCANKLIEEFTCITTVSLTTQIDLLPFLGYSVYVEAKLSPGLALRNNYQIYIVEPTQTDLTSYLELSNTSSTQGIVIYWNNQISTCSNISLAFSISLNGTFLPSQHNYTIPCSQGNYSFQNLIPINAYQINYGFYYSNQQSSCFISENNHFIIVETLSVCSLSPCGQGICQDTTIEEEGYYMCNCSSGYTFTNCTCVDIDECANPNFCQNANCSNSMFPYICDCLFGYEELNETTCVDINECLNNATCINGNCTNEIAPTFYNCTCFIGYGGVNCNTLLVTSTQPEMTTISETSTISPIGSVCPNETTTSDLGNNITWPETQNGSISKIPCSQLDLYLFGYITRTCGEDGVWEMPNLDACAQEAFSMIDAQVANITNFEPVEIVAFITEVTIASSSSNILFPRDIAVSEEAVTAVLTNLGLQDAAQLNATLPQVQQDIINIASNVFSVNNSDSIDALSNSVDVITGLIDDILFLGNLITQTLEPGADPVILEDINVGLIAQVAIDVIEDLIIGPSNATSNNSAIFTADAEIRIPASAISNTTSGVPIDISISFFSTVFQLGSQIPTASSGLTGNNINVGTGVISISISERNGSEITTFTEDIIINFGFQNTSYQALALDTSFELTFQCQSLQNGDRNVGWRQNGVILDNPDQVPFSPAVCRVSHLTSFAVLVSVNSIVFTPLDRLILDILTYATGGLSILFLILSLVLYAIVFIRTKKMKDSLFNKDATYLHVNFAVSLLLALVFFMITPTGYGNDIACNILTLVSYYFWLTVFFSSLTIGLFVFVKILTWSRDVKYWYYLVISAWILPILFVILVGPSRWNDLTDGEGMNCWLNASAPYHVNLAFIIPMVSITLVNMVFLIVTIVVMYRISSMKNQIKKLKSLTIATIVFTPILGIPWFFGIVSSIPTSAFAYIFTVILGLQGFFFAILYPLRTREVIDYALKWRSPTKEALKMQTRSTHSDPSTSSKFVSAAQKFKIKPRKREPEISTQSDFDMNPLEITPYVYSAQVLEPRYETIKESRENLLHPSPEINQDKDHNVNGTDKSENPYQNDLPTNKDNSLPPNYYEIADIIEPEDNDSTKQNSGLLSQDK